MVSELAGVISPSVYGIELATNLEEHILSLVKVTFYIHLFQYLAYK